MQPDNSLIVIITNSAEVALLVLGNSEAASLVCVATTPQVSAGTSPQLPCHLKLPLSADKLPYGSFLDSIPTST